MSSIRYDQATLLVSILFPTNVWKTGIETSNYMIADVKCLSVSADFDFISDNILTIFKLIVWTQMGNRTNAGHLNMNDLYSLMRFGSREELNSFWFPRMWESVSCFMGIYITRKHSDDIQSVLISVHSYGRIESLIIS